MNILIGGGLILGFVFCGVVLVYRFWCLFQNDEYTEIFNAENMPSVQEEAWREFGGE